MSIEGGCAIVTGAGRGIGRAIALRLAARGMNVLAVARTSGDLETTVAQAAGLPGTCTAYAADVGRSDQIDGVVKAALERFGKLDVLVNNAGVAPLCGIERITDALLAETLAVNVSAVVYACRAAWTALGRSRGTIVNLSSLSAVDPFPGFALYGATKAWVNVFTRALAAEGRQAGIKVFAVGPGAVETDMLRKAFPDFPADQTLQPADVAAAVEWLLDARAEHMTGQTIYVKK